MSAINLGLQEKSIKAVNESQRAIESLNRIVDWGDNLYNGDKVDNYVIGSNGQLVALNGYMTTGYIPVSASVYPTLKQVMYRSVTIQNDAYTRIAFYDGSKNYIDGSYQQEIQSNTEIDIPTNAAYCRLCCGVHPSYPNAIVINYSPFFKGILGQNYSEPKLRQESNKGNLISKIIDGAFVVNSTGVIRRTLTTKEAASVYIPVEYGHRYFCNAPLYNNNNDRIWEYDKDLNPISFAARSPFYTPSSKDVKYVVFTYELRPSIDTFIGFIDAEDWDGNWGTQIANNGQYEERKVSQGFPIDGHYLVGAYGEHKVIQRYSSGDLYYINGDIRSAEVQTIALTSDNFPNLLSGSFVNYVIFFETNEGVRSLVFMSDNQIYCSTTGAFSGFEEPNIWDLKGRKHWRVADDDKDPTGERYRAYFPSDYKSKNTKKQNAFMWHNGPVWLNGIGGQYSRGLLFANYTNTYQTNTALPSCVFYTEDGKNIYIQYMFGVYQKYYKTSDDLTTEKSSVNYNLGDDIDFSTLGTYGGGLSIKKRWNILPSESVSDPTEVFEYGDAISISAISGKNLTLSSASSLKVGDTIIIQGTTGTNLDKVTNNAASAENGGTTAFIVKSISGNTISLADAIGNVANNLMCRHIHGIQEFGEGVVVYTGEEYPESYIMYIHPFMSNVNDGFNMNAARWFDDVVRLNSSKNAHQRGLGVYLRSDGKVVFIADSNSPNAAKLKVRGKAIKMGNYGIHVFDLADIDDASKSLTKIQGQNAGYALYYIMGVLFYSDYKGKTYISKDEGDSWEFLSVDGLTKSFHLGFTNMEQTHFFEASKSQVLVQKLL